MKTIKMLEETIADYLCILDAGKYFLEHKKH